MLLSIQNWPVSPNQEQSRTRSPPELRLQPVSWPLPEPAQRPSELIRKQVWDSLSGPSGLGEGTAFA